MKLSSLMFADDLLLFSKGDVGSMMILLRTFSTFSKASGLQMSKGKSNVYFNGVPATTRSEIVQVSGCIEGALPFKYIRNKAAVGKLLWWIHAHPDKLWVKWIHSNYLRGTAWREYQCPSDVSWTWKKLCKLRQEMQTAYLQNEWVVIPGKEYTVGKGYNWMQRDLPEVGWHHQVWNKWTIPKHGMIAWMYQHQGLNTKDKLFRLNISSDDLCCICGNEEESPQHLFFRCPYSAEIMLQIQNWTGVRMPTSREHDWGRTASLTRLKLGILRSILNAVTYHVWRQRNGCRHDMKLLRPEGCITMIQYEIRTKIKNQSKGKLARRDLVWIEKLM
ncbi:uncharacterized protein LOC141637222 [Silene latifolia]|uniref:uncharacterized protein LOC141637222 n=1 Tax=Silene latifolia TaxID=37657 RepID=UPI003D784F26